MMSRTVRVFKLMYIVAGILMSNEEICDTVDRIQIAPRVEVKPEIETPKKVQRLNAENRRTASRKRSWLGKYDVLLIVRNWREFLQTMLRGFNIWTIPNYFLVYSSNFISKKLFLNRDCDIIYK